MTVALLYMKVSRKQNHQLAIAEQSMNVGMIFSRDTVKAADIPASTNEAYELSNFSREAVYV